MQQTKNGWNGPPRDHVCTMKKKKKGTNKNVQCKLFSKIVLPLFSLSEMYSKKMQDIWTGLLFLVQFYRQVYFTYCSSLVGLQALWRYICACICMWQRVCVCVSGKTFALKLETALWIISEARHVHPENLKMHQASQKKGSGVCWHEQYKRKVFTGTVGCVDVYRNSLWKGNCLHEYLGRKRLQNK